AQHGPGARGGNAAAAGPRSVGAVRHRRLEARGNRRVAGDGGRQFQGATASGARLAARTAGGTRMNHGHDDRSLDATLRLQLRGLRRDIEPAADLWPGIVERIAQAPARPRPNPAQRYVPWALAASLVLAVGVAW